MAYEEDYWLADDFADFLRWYVETDNFISKPVEGMLHIIEIVEKPYRRNYRTLYHAYINEKYENG